MVLGWWDDAVVHGRLSVSRRPVVVVSNTNMARGRDPVCVPLSRLGVVWEWRGRSPFLPLKVSRLPLASWPFVVVSLNLTRTRTCRFGGFFKENAALISAGAMYFHFSERSVRGRCHRVHVSLPFGA